MTELTLLFLRKDSEILLAMKKRGFGEGRWNGVGGKLEPGETIQQALVRECREEIQVTPKDFWQVAELTFDAFFKSKRTLLLVHVYMCEHWKGNPSETEEMRPEWFEAAKIPYDDMWQDDKYWLPQVLEDKKVRGKFTFDKQDNLLDYSVSEVAGFERE